MRFLTSTLSVWLLALGSSFAAEEEAHHGLPLKAETVLKIGPLVISNSIIMVWLAVAIIVLFARIATKKVTMVPAGLQNFAEFAIESLYSFLEGLMGAHLVKRTFWFFGSIFFFILITNWMGLIPGVGTIGHYDEHGHIIPWLRGANADLNMTSAMSLMFGLLWFYWALTENNLKGFLGHIFAPKGDFAGFMKLAMIPVFLFVGVLELISIGIRPVALSFRLFGNIYGGEQTLEALMSLIPAKMQLWVSWAPAFPFYFMELLVGAVQALVFTLLCAIFLKLICDHGDDHADAHH